MLKYAFKEWAVICQALAEGRQGLILRKGGIAETSGKFQLEHKRFWLYPTWFHQQVEGIQQKALPLWEKAQEQKPPPGVVRLTHFAEVTGIYHVKDFLMAQMLAHLHVWSDETIKKRFAYRSPGLFVLAVRVYKCCDVLELPELEEYEGCRSWVDLDREFPTEDATPVLPDKDLDNLHRQLDLLLNPTALA